MPISHDIVAGGPLFHPSEGVLTRKYRPPPTTRIEPNTITRIDCLRVTYPLVWSCVLAILTWKGKGRRNKCMAGKDLVNGEPKFCGQARLDNISRSAGRYGLPHEVRILDHGEKYDVHMRAAGREPAGHLKPCQLRQSDIEN